MTTLLIYLAFYIVGTVWALQTDYFDDLHDEFGFVPSRRAIAIANMTLALTVFMFICFYYRGKTFIYRIYGQWYARRVIKQLRKKYGDKKED